MRALLLLPLLACTASPLTSLGAVWIWSHGCLDLGQGWFRAELTLP